MEPETITQFSSLGISSISPLKSRYSGSSPFQDDDLSRLLFFGRSTEKDALLHKILVEDLVVLYSRSGLGKTSLLNAGILAPLRERGFFPMICRLYVGDGLPQSDPLKSIYGSIEENIAKAHSDRIIEEYHPGKKDTLWEYFKTLEIWSPDDVLLTPVLILDQFEELFTFYERDKRQAFSEQLGDLVRGSIPKSIREQYFQPTEAKPAFPYSEKPPKVKILLSLREEYLGHLAELARDLPSILKSGFRLTPLQRENAKEAIVGPAEFDKRRIAEKTKKDLVNLRITEPFSYDAEKLQEILNFLSNPEENPEGIEQDEVDPTQLQILCQYIEEKVQERLSREPGKEVVVDNKLLLGKNEMRAAIKNFYDRAIDKIQLRSNRRNVLALIENGLISRNNRRLSLAQGDIQHRFHVSPETLQELAKVRLLRPDHRLGDVYYELSHDTLIRPIQQSKKNRQAKKKKIIFAAFFVLVACGIGTTFLMVQHYNAKAIAKANEANENAALAFNRAAAVYGRDKKWNESRLYSLRALACFAAVRDPGQNPEGPAYAYGRLADQPQFPVMNEDTLQPQGTTAFSPDGRLLACGSEDGAVRLYDVSSRQVLGEPLTGHGGAVTSVAFSPDGKLLASGSKDKTVRLWDVANRKVLREPLTGHGGTVTSVAFSPDGRLLASGSKDGTVRLWKVASGKLQRKLAGRKQEDKQAITSLAFSPNGRWLASGSESQTVAFSPDGRLRPSGSKDATVRLWDVASGKPWGEPLAGRKQDFTSVAFSPDSRVLASGSIDGVVRLWEVRSGKRWRERLTGYKGIVTSVAFSPDGELLASASKDGTVRLWDAARYQVLAVLTAPKGHFDSLAFSPDGRRLLASGSDSDDKKTVSVFCLWNLSSRQLLALTGQGDWVTNVAFSQPDGRVLASTSIDKTVRLWDVASRQVLATLTGHTDEVWGVAFSPDGHVLATGSDDKTVRLWDVKSRELLATLPGHTDPGHTERVISVAFSPDDRLLASSSRDGTVRLWDVDSQKVQAVLTGHEGPVSGVAFSPDGRLLASASDDMTVRMWDVARRQPLDTLKGHKDEVWSVAFSPNGRLLASASRDGTVRLWEVPSGKPWGEPLTGHKETGHKEIFTSVAFSPDSQFLASGSWDNTVRLWHVASRQVKAVFAGHVDDVTSVAFSPDGKFLASSSKDETVRLCDLEPFLELLFDKQTPWRKRIDEAEHDYRMHLDPSSNILQPFSTSGELPRTDLSKPFELGKP
jgi:WD40 repeat protein